MNVIGAIVLARYSSRRLPGKALIKINGKHVLSYSLERLKKVFKSSSIVLATSVDPSDDPIEEFAVRNNIAVFRGSLTNVAERFFQAAVANGLTYGVRINGDNVFVDTTVLREMVDIAASGKYDFVSNVKGRTFPKGMSIEIVRMAFYQQCLPDIGKFNEHSEHVTSYLYNHAGGNFFYYYNSLLPEAAGIQMALDTPEDLERTRLIVNEFTRPQEEYNLPEVLSIWKSLKHEQRI
jgi:spore coat polysaccharide biosynthesis protein SpsF